MEYRSSNAENAQLLCVVKNIYHLLYSHAWESTTMFSDVCEARQTALGQRDGLHPNPKRWYPVVSRRLNEWRMDLLYHTSSEGSEDKLFFISFIHCKENPVGRNTGAAFIESTLILNKTTHILSKIINKKMRFILFKKRIYLQFNNSVILPKTPTKSQRHLVPRASRL